MTGDKLASKLQYTNVRADATREDIRRHCECAAEYRFNAVMVQPCWIGMAREILRGTGVRVASAVAYPMGGETANMKAALAREAVRIGADELDFQPNIGFLRSRMLDEFVDEIRLVVEAAGGRPVKSMSEFAFLTEDEKILCVTLAEEAGVAFVKNSSGIGPGGSAATPEAIEFIGRHLTGKAKIKASGQIKSYFQAVALLEAGAALIGTSAAKEIVSHASAASTVY